MRLNGKLVGELTAGDMQQLRDDRRPEDLYLDYKQDAYGKVDADKRELLKDIVGLANASGGVILIGIDEDKSNVAAATPVWR
jgi:predicted HTH transcriptional regulator